MRIVTLVPRSGASQGPPLAPCSSAPTFALTSRIAVCFVAVSYRSSRSVTRCAASSAVNAGRRVAGPPGCRAATPGRPRTPGRRAFEPPPSARRGGSAGTELCWETGSGCCNSVKFRQLGGGKGRGVGAIVAKGSTADRESVGRSVTGMRCCTHLRPFSETRHLSPDVDWSMVGRWPVVIIGHSWLRSGLPSRKLK